MLNPKLYEALKNKFGDVKISNEGANYVAKRRKRVVKGNIVSIIEDINRGEQYCVNCPACGGKFKLTISYISGTTPSPHVKPVWHKVHCFKCDYGKSPGNKEELKKLLSGYSTLVSAGAVKLKKSSVSSEKPLEDYGKLAKIHEDSSAAMYLEGRGFDPVKLSKIYNFRRMDEPRESREFLTNYIFIPMYRFGKLVSWQARAIYPSQSPRWYIAKGGKKPIFGLDLAAQTSCIIIQEGVFDAIACGFSGTAIMGKFLTGYQSESLRDVKKPIVVCLDPDASADAKKLYIHLKESHGNLVSLFKYPDNWPEEYSIDKKKMIPKDAASVGNKVICPLLNKHLKENYNGVELNVRGTI